MFFFFGVFFEWFIGGCDGVEGDPTDVLEVDFDPAMGVEVGECEGGFLWVPGTLAESDGDTALEAEGSQEEGHSGGEVLAVADFGFEEEFVGRVAVGGGW